jgi:transcriptional regulator with XRE-family HTH domain
MDKAQVSLFAKRLRKLREERGWSQEYLAKEADLTSKQVYNYERGYNLPRERNILDLATALQISVAKLCPFFSVAPLEDLLEERIREEVTSLDSFLTLATPRDLEKLECLLRAYELSTGQDKLDVDILLHRTISSFDKRGTKRKVNTLILQYFSQIDEFVLESDLLSEENEEKLSSIHVPLIKASLNKDKEGMLALYEEHLVFSKEFLANTFSFL